MAGHIPYNKIHWTEDQLAFMVDNFNVMTNKELAVSLGMKITSVRTKLYEMGHYKMKLEYWTDEQVEFLKINYKELGDTELAEIFNQKWHKEKGWSKKHIEKKRRYLDLKRTDVEKANIFDRNKSNGAWAMCPINAWKTRGGASPDGTVRFWRSSGGERLIPYIKINGTFIHWNRWYWEQMNGPIPTDHYVVFVGDTSLLTIHNLRLISAGQYKKEFSRKAVTDLSDNYVAGTLSRKNKDIRKEIAKDKVLIQAKRNQLKINRKIKQYGKEQDTGS